jgi:hypothetical protein
MRFIVPHGGHGGIGFALTLVEPYVESPPYTDPPPLLLKADAIGAPIFDAPGGQQVGELESQQLVVEEASRLRQGAGEPAYELYCGLWAQLSGDTGFECSFALVGMWARIADGWVLVQVSPEGP